MKWFLAALLLVLVTYMIAGFLGAFRQAPAEPDARLVGRWRGYWRQRPHPGPGFVFIVEDGTLHFPGVDSAKWRTQDGILYLKYKILSDKPLYEQVPYTVSPNGRSVKFQGDSWVLPTDMQR